MDLLQLGAVVVVWFGLCDASHNRFSIDEQDVFLGTLRSAHGFKHRRKY